jgi:hypothetical protein
VPTLCYLCHEKSRLLQLVWTAMKDTQVCQGVS